MAEKVTPEPRRFKTWQVLLASAVSFAAGSAVAGRRKGKARTKANGRLPNGGPPEGSRGAPSNISLNTPETTAAAEAFLESAAGRFEEMLVQVESDLALVLADDVQVPNWNGIDAQMIAIMNLAREIVLETERFKEHGASAYVVTRLEDLVTNIMRFGRHARQSILARWGGVEGGRYVPTWATEGAEPQPQQAQAQAEQPQQQQQQQAASLGGTQPGGMGNPKSARLIDVGSPA